MFCGTHKLFTEDFQHVRLQMSTKENAAFVAYRYREVSEAAVSEVIACESELQNAKRQIRCGSEDGRNSYWRKVSRACSLFLLEVTQESHLTKQRQHG